MLDIDFYKFDDFYNKQIKPRLFIFEKERKKIIFEFKIARFIFTLPVFVGISIYGLLFLIRNFLSDEAAIYLGVILPIFVPFAVMIYAISIYNKALDKKKRYIKKLKNQVYKVLFNLLGLNYSTSVSPNFADYQNAILKYFPEKKFISKDKSVNITLFTYFMKFEDEISGVFKDIPFELCDATLIKKIEINKEKPEDSIFQGLMLAVKLNKNFNDETIIKTKNFKLFDIKKSIINLEDIEFSKKYNVYNNDQVEGRYLLTTAFMDRLYNFGKTRKDKTIIFFNSTCSEYKNMFILTNTGKDNFEIPFNKSILNKKYYYNLLKELVDMLEIAVALKLEKKINL